MGNPFSQKRTAGFDNTKQLPKELQEMIPTLTEKYIFINLIPLREHSYGRKYSEDFKQFIFGYDVIVLVNNAQALTMLE